MIKTFLFFTLISLICFVMLIAPEVHGATIGNCDTGTIRPALCNPFGGVSDPKFVLERVFTALGTIIGILAIAMVLYSSFRMLISRGEPQTLGQAKTGLVYAIVGLVASIMSYAIVFALGNFIGLNNQAPGFGNPLASTSMQDFITNIVVRFAQLIGTVALVMVVYSGFVYMTAAGNEEKTRKGKNGLLWSVVGFLTAILAYVIINAVKVLFF